MNIQGIEFMVYAFIIILLAAHSAAILFLMTRKTGRKDKEFRKLLFKIVLLEIPFFLVIGLVESVLEFSLSLLNGAETEDLAEAFLEFFFLVYKRPDMENPLIIFVMSFFIIGPVEEVFKLLGAAIPTWDSPGFKRRFDGIVFCGTSALTYAFLENIEYVIQADNPLLKAVNRAVICTPGHFMLGVLTGIFYSRARIAANKGNRSGKIRNLFLAVLIPSLIHGLYDTISLNISRLLDVVEKIDDTASIIKLLLLIAGAFKIVGGSYLVLFTVIFRRNDIIKETEIPMNIQED